VACPHTTAELMEQTNSAIDKYLTITFPLKYTHELPGTVF